jgi:hypothetical protein
VAVASGEAVADHYLKAITLEREIETAQDLSQLLGLTAGELEVLIESAKREALDRWWTINEIIPPRAGNLEQMASAKSSLDDLLDDLDKLRLPDAGCTHALSPEQDAMWPVAEAVQREMARYERTRSRAEATLKDLDRALEAASVSGPPMHPRLKALAQALSIHTVPEDWFHDQATGGASLENESGSRLHDDPSFSGTSSDASLGSVSVHDWVDMMQTCLSQFTAWQVALSQTAVDASENVRTAQSSPFQVNPRAVFRIRELLAACRLAIARRRGWVLAETCWRAVVNGSGRLPTNSDAPHRTATHDCAGNGVEDGCVALVGLQIHGATWTENEGLHQLVEDEATSPTDKDIPSIMLTLVQNGNQESDTTSEVYYECPVFKQVGAKRDWVFTVKLQVARSEWRWETRGVSLIC